MSNDGLVKRISFRSSPSGTPEIEYFDPEATVGDILARFSVSPTKADITVGGMTVDTDYVPDPGAEVVIQPKKYSSGAK